MEAKGRSVHLPTAENKLLYEASFPAQLNAPTDGRLTATVFVFE